MVYRLLEEVEAVEALVLDIREYCMVLVEVQQLLPHNQKKSTSLIPKTVLSLSKMERFSSTFVRKRRKRQVPDMLRPV
jgi:hypothetical protein